MNYTIQTIHETRKVMDDLDAMRQLSDASNAGELALLRFHRIVVGETVWSDTFKKWIWQWHGPKIDAVEKSLGLGYSN